MHRIMGLICGWLLFCLLFTLNAWAKQNPDVPIEDRIFTLVDQALQIGTQVELKETTLVIYPNELTIKISSACIDDSRMLITFSFPETTTDTWTLDRTTHQCLTTHQLPYPHRFSDRLDWEEAQALIEILEMGLDLRPIPVWKAPLIDLTDNLLGQVLSGATHLEYKGAMVPIGELFGEPRRLFKLECMLIRGPCLLEAQIYEERRRQRLRPNW